MADPAGIPVSFERAPEEIIRRFGIRHRICGSLRWLGTGWLALGVLVYWDGVAHHSDRISMAGFAIFAIGVALETAAIVVAWAIQRCPACDKRVGIITTPLYCTRCPARLR